MHKLTLCAAAWLLALGLAGCRAPAPAETAATPETAAPVTPEQAAATALDIGDIGPAAPGDGERYYTIRKKDNERDGLICVIDADGSETPVCAFDACRHDSEACPAWLADANRYQLRMVGGQLCAIYTQPLAETVETLLLALSSEEGADPGAAARRALYNQPSRIERVTPTSRDWLGQLDVSEDLREQMAMVSWMYADENALYGTSYVDTAAFETGQRLVRWGLDGTLTVLPLPCPEYSTVLGIDGSRVLYMHESTPVDRLSLYESGNFVLFEQVGFAADKEFRVWDLATGQDRLVFTNPPDAGDLLCVGMTQDMALLARSIDPDTDSARIEFYRLYLGRSETLYDYVSAAPSATYMGTNGYRLVGPQGAPGWFAAQTQSTAPAAWWQFDLCLFDAATGEAAGRFSGFGYQGYVLTPVAVLGDRLLCTYWDNSGEQFLLVPLDALYSGDPAALSTRAVQVKRWAWAGGDA